MSETRAPDPFEPVSPNSPDDALSEGGLRAPPGLSPLRKFWWWFDFVILVKLARLRFIGVLIVIGLTQLSIAVGLTLVDSWRRRGKKTEPFPVTPPEDIAVGSGTVTPGFSW